MNLSSVVYDDAGSPVEAALVEAYPLSGGPPAAWTSTDENGRWSLTNLADGAYRIKVSFGGLVRWIDPDQVVQIQQLVGLDGVTAPLAVQSVTSAHLKDGAVTRAKIPSGAVDEARLDPAIGYFKLIKVGTVTITAGKSDQVELVGQGGVQVTADAGAKRITIEAASGQSVGGDLFMDLFLLQGV